MAALYAFGSALPAPQFFFPQGNRQRPQRPFFRPGGPLGLGILVPHEQRPGQQPAAPAVPATAPAAPPSPVADPPPPIPSTPLVNPTGEVVPAAGAVPVNPGSLFTDGQGANNNNNQLAGRKCRLIYSFRLVYAQLAYRFLHSILYGMLTYSTWNAEWRSARISYSWRRG